MSALALQSIIQEELAKMRAQVSPLSLLERDWRLWLPKMGPLTFTGSFAPFHAEFWNWYWRLLAKRRRLEPLTEEEKVFLAFWPRGGGKSSNVEWGALAEGALLKRGYVLYVCGKQDSAIEHVASIKERIESEEIAEFYPHLANPKLGRHGNQYGWRQEFLITEGGWAIRPVGLLEGIRGSRRGDLRPTLIVFDDVDELDDSPAVVQKKLRRIARSIIPAGAKDTIILFPQNLIHDGSVAHQVHKRKVDVLQRRIESGPFPAFSDLRIELQQTDAGPRNVIVEGEPLWADMDLLACQDFLDKSGREAFLAEYQHDFEAGRQGRVIPEYDEIPHVITWSMFQAMFGARFIPSNWEREVGLDVGFTEEHLSAWTWIATSAENTPLPGKRFRYRGLTFQSPLLDEMAEMVKVAMAPDRSVGRRFDELPLIKRWRMSHEAKSERDTLRTKHGMGFLPCKSGKTDGVAQWRHFLRVDKSRPHPFKDDVEIKPAIYDARGDLIERAIWQIGEPGWFDVVDDGQDLAPRDDRGLKQHREEVLVWRWKPTPLTDAGFAKEEPVNAFDDANASTRMITAEWGPGVTPMSRDEQVDQAMPKQYQRARLQQMTPAEINDQQMNIVAARERAERQVKKKGGHWGDEIFGSKEGSNPWDKKR